VNSISTRFPSDQGATCSVLALLLALPCPVLVCYGCSHVCLPVPAMFRVQWSMSRWAPSCVGGWRSPSVSRTQQGQSSKQTQTNQTRSHLQALSSSRGLVRPPHRGQHQENGRGPMVQQSSRQQP
jgi:hypothetical protein